MRLHVTIKLRILTSIYNLTRKHRVRINVKLSNDLYLCLNVKLIRLEEDAGPAVSFEMAPVSQADMLID